MMLPSTIDPIKNELQKHSSVADEENIHWYVFGSREKINPEKSLDSVASRKNRQRKNVEVFPISKAATIEIRRNRFSQRERSQTLTHSTTIYEKFHFVEKKTFPRDPKD